MSSALEYWVRLGMAFGCGSSRTDEIIRQYGDAETFFLENGPRDMARLTPAERQRLFVITQESAARVVEQAQERSVTILTPEDNRFPQRLRDITGVPCVLYVEGDLGDIDNRLAIAMVGTRRCSDYGFRAAAKIAGELARAGAIVVSGMAMGVDTACHTAAVNEDAPTIAVLGCGLDKNYPAQNQSLRERIAQKGAVITEYAPGVEPQPANFPKRNRIISGLCVGTIVVEAGLRSGSLITAGLAAEQGRDIFAVPGDIFRGTSAGTFRLLQEGCAPICCGADVLEEYRYRFALKLEPVPPSAEETAPEQQTLEQPRLRTPVPEPPGLTGEPLELFRLLGAGGRNVEELAAHTAKPVGAVLTALTQLELLGAVEALPGGRYAQKQPNA